MGCENERAEDESDEMVRDSVNPQSAYMACVPSAYAEPSVKASYSDSPLFELMGTWSVEACL